MPLPDRLRAWMDADPHNGKIITALIQGAAAGVAGVSIPQRASELGYTARTAAGDAFEEGWLFGESERAHLRKENG